MLSDPKCIETISLTGGVNALIEQLEVDDTELQLGSMKLLSALSIDSLPPTTETVILFAPREK